MRPSTKLGLRPPLLLGEQRISTIPPAIWALVPPSSQVEAASKKTNPSKDSPAEVLPSSNSPSREAKQNEVPIREEDTTKGVVPNTIKPETASKDPSKGKTPPRTLRSSWQPFQCLPKMILRARVQPLPQLQQPNPPSLYQKITLISILIRA